jgi:hypothetical protein
MKISRSFAVASAWTFTIKPINKLLSRYVPPGGIGWVDPFAGDNSPAQFTNDQNPERAAIYHMDAEEFCKTVKGPFDGLLPDPPYSYRQVSEHYKMLGLKARAIDTSANFYYRVMNAISPKIKTGGVAISFGWNSNAFGKKQGFEIEEILLVAHGMHHNDTIVTVERKVV